MHQTQKTDAVDQNPVLRITRNFNAPPKRVYAAFTNPGDLEKWFGPEGVNCIVHEIDPRPRGALKKAPEQAQPLSKGNRRHRVWHGNRPDPHRP